MPAQYAPAIAFLAGALVAMLASTRFVTLGAQLQQEILKRGAVAQGRILRIWRPPVFGAFTRVYFEFQPHDGPDSRCRRATSIAAWASPRPRCLRSAPGCG